MEFIAKIRNGASEQAGVLELTVPKVIRDAMELKANEVVKVAIERVPENGSTTNC